VKRDEQEIVLLMDESEVASATLGEKLTNLNPFVTEDKDK
jgi:hypothetical protein